MVYYTRTSSISSTVFAHSVSICFGFCSMCKGETNVQFVAMEFRGLIIRLVGGSGKSAFLKMLKHSRQIIVVWHSTQHWLSIHYMLYIIVRVIFCASISLSLSLSLPRFVAGTSSKSNECYVEQALKTRTLARSHARARSFPTKRSHIC